MGLFGLFSDAAANETGSEVVSGAADLLSTNPLGFGFRSIFRSSNAGEGSDKPLGVMPTKYSQPSALEWQRKANEAAAKKQYEDSLAATKAWGERTRAALGVSQPPKPVGSVGEPLGTTPQAQPVGGVGAPLGTTPQTKPAGYFAGGFGGVPPSKPLSPAASQAVPSWEETFRATDKYR